jgi:DNA-binding NarL/FixJ family response regulator
MVIRDVADDWAADTVSVYAVLTGREREVLQLLAEGQDLQQIAEALDLSPKTVEAHRRQLMNKLGLRTVAELTKYAIRHGLTSLDE